MRSVTAISPVRGPATIGRMARLKVFQLESLLAERARRGYPYHEFLRVPSLSCGIYVLAKGAKDLQGPHDEDEVYYVVSGRARIRVDAQEHEVSAGSVLFVGATQEHSFIEIEEDTTFLVFFASGGEDEAQP
jgi:mannose-6-phosphate isomerase-like protein (cupin superfamily)